MWAHDVVGVVGVVCGPLAQQRPVVGALVAEGVGEAAPHLPGRMACRVVLPMPRFRLIEPVLAHLRQRLDISGDLIGQDRDVAVLMPEPDEPIQVTVLFFVVEGEAVGAKPRQLVAISQPRHRLPELGRALLTRWERVVAVISPHGQGGVFNPVIGQLIATQVRVQQLRVQLPILVGQRTAEPGVHLPHRTVPGSMIHHTVLIAHTHQVHPTRPAGEGTEYRYPHIFRLPE